MLLILAFLKSLFLTKPLSNGFLLQLRFWITMSFSIDLLFGLIVDFLLFFDVDLALELLLDPTEAKLCFPPTTTHFTLLIPDVVLVRLCFDFTVEGAVQIVKNGHLPYLFRQVVVLDIALGKPDFIWLQRNFYMAMLLIHRQVFYFSRKVAVLVFILPLSAFRNDLELLVDSVVVRISVSASLI